MTILTTDGILAVAEVLGVQTLPAVLAVYPRQPTMAEDRAARATALAELRGSGVVNASGDLDDELAAAISILAQPDSEIAARICRGGAIDRVCVARRGIDHAVAVRRSNDIEVCTLWAAVGDSAALARPILAALGLCPPADLAVFSAPTDELAERLDRAAARGECAEALHILGMPERDALGLGMALQQCHAVTEIVACGYGDGLTTRAPMAAAVFDTAQGRIVASGSRTAANRTWSTFAPGSDLRVAGAIANLIEWLSEGRFMFSSS